MNWLPKDDDDNEHHPRSIHSLMLKDSEYSMLLHGEYPKSEARLVDLLDGLDFVLERWVEGMIGSLPPEDHEGVKETASQALMSVMACRFAIVDFMSNDSSVTEFMDVLRAIKELKQEFVYVAKPYHNIGHLFNWYLDLPLKVQFSFKYLHNLHRGAELHHKYSNHSNRGSLYK